MNYNNLKEGQKVFFVNENLPMTIISRSDRYAVVVRSLDKKEDYKLLCFEVERCSYVNMDDAYQELKDEPVYSLLDFVEEKKAPSNYIFCPYNFFDKLDCVKAIKDLESGEHELSRRHGVDLNIDWSRTMLQKI